MELWSSKEAHSGGVLRGEEPWYLLDQFPCYLHFPSLGHLPKVVTYPLDVVGNITGQIKDRHKILSTKFESSFVEPALDEIQVVLSWYWPKGHEPSHLAKGPAVSLTIACIPEASEPEDIYEMCSCFWISERRAFSTS